MEIYCFCGTPANAFAVSIYLGYKLDERNGKSDLILTKSLTPINKLTEA